MLLIAMLTEALVASCWDFLEMAIATAIQMPDVIIAPITSIHSWYQREAKGGD
jgi:hypothetical protein